MPQSPPNCHHNLVQHLSIHTAADGWAKACLEELQREARPIVVCDRGGKRSLYARGDLN
ncbi:hypothetical protein [Rubidibacter lacunae]|uniref:hypothetical protein n=1 Tax=Rubidibacter lacunae TaxID=582514 RepID=UPI00041AEC92|nr:hypothetical protein [Rubidibacter lacunae]